MSHSEDVSESPRRKPRQDGLRSRAALIAGAQEVFALLGVDAPMDTIARHAGVSNATLYRHFPRRVDLVIEVLVLVLHRGKEALEEGRKRVDAWEGLTLYLNWLFTEQVQNQAYMSGLRAVPSGTNGQVDALRNTTVADLVDLINRAKTEGSFRRDRWVEDLFLLMALNEQMSRTGLQDVQTGSRRFLDLCLAALSSSDRVQAGELVEPETVLGLRRTLGHEIAGLPYADIPSLQGKVSRVSG